MSGARVLRILGVLALAAMVGLLVFAGVWRLQGGRIERVESPSMGTRAPVGSLLWVKPVDATTLRVGDFITFRAPGQGTTYSHLVRKIHRDGTIGTGGAISGRDPWRLHSADIIGEVRMTWPRAGWVARVSPVLLAGFLLVALVVRRLRAHWRAPTALVGASLVLAAVIVIYRPFTHAEQLAFKPVDDGVRATYVGTGLLPVRLQAESGGAYVDLDNGEVGSVQVTGSTDSNQFVVRLSPAVPFAFWLGLAGVCFVPALVDSTARLVRRRSGGVPV